MERKLPNRLGMARTLCSGKWEGKGAYLDGVIKGVVDKLYGRGEC